MLWWGWLAFNAGSTFGISGNKWRLSAKVNNISIYFFYDANMYNILLETDLHTPPPQKKININKIIEYYINKLIFYFSNWRHVFIKACITTAMASFSGGLVGMIQSYTMNAGKQVSIKLTDSIVCI